MQAPTDAAMMTPVMLAYPMTQTAMMSPINTILPTVMSPWNTPILYNNVTNPNPVQPPALMPQQQQFVYNYPNMYQNSY